MCVSSHSSRRVNVKWSRPNPSFAACLQRFFNRSIKLTCHLSDKCWPGVSLTQREEQQNKKKKRTTLASTWSGDERRKLETDSSFFNAAWILLMNDRFIVSVCVFIYYEMGIKSECKRAYLLPTAASPSISCVTVSVSSRRRPLPLPSPPPLGLWVNIKNTKIQLSPRRTHKFIYRNKHTHATWINNAASPWTCLASKRQVEQASGSQWTRLWITCQARFNSLEVLKVDLKFKSRSDTSLCNNSISKHTVLCRDQDVCPSFYWTLSFIHHQVC